MKHISVALVLIVALAILACDVALPFTASPAPTATLPAKIPPSSQPPRAQSSQSSAPVSVPSSTPTGLPRIVVPTTPTTVAGSYAFHINFAVDQSVACSNNCDSAYIPKMNLYFRGKISVVANRATGDGTITFDNIEPCITLKPNQSSCKVNGNTAGSFTVTGSMQGDKLEMTMQLKDVPRLNVMWATGTINVPMDSTYYEELKQLMLQAKIFDTPFQITPTILASGMPSQTIANSSRTFDGKYIFATNDKLMTRTTHGFGTLFFIQP
jgi:hypothetical protein